MKTIRNTYRLISAITTIVFAIGIVVPAGVSAAGLFCDMGHSAMNATDHSCCDHLPMEERHGNHDSGQSTLPAETPCDMQSLCMNAVDAVPHQAPVVSQQMDSKGHVANLTGEIPFHTGPKAGPATIIRLHAVPPGAPPIFLVNASFLN